MKNKFLFKFGAVALVMGTLATTIPVSAQTYVRQSFSGKSQKGATMSLGSGERFLYGYGKGGSGTGVVRQVNSNAPDKTVTGIYLNGTDINGEGYDEDSFTADSSSEYYIKWLGESASSRAQLVLGD